MLRIIDEDKRNILLTISCIFNYNFYEIIKALEKLRGKGYEKIDEEIEEMRIEARRASSVETFTMKKLLVTPELKLPLIIAIVVQIAQQWSGINAVSNPGLWAFTIYCK